MIAFAGMGCVGGGADATIDLVFDPCMPLVIDVRGLAADEMASVVAGAALWNDAAGTRLSLAGEDAEAVPVMLPVRFDTAAPFFLGVYDDEHGEIVINRRIDGERARAITVAHELGHAFGLAHVDAEARRSLMNPENVEIAPSLEDVAQLREIWASCAE